MSDYIEFCKKTLTTYNQHSLAAIFFAIIGVAAVCGNCPPLGLLLIYLSGYNAKSASIWRPLIKECRDVVVGSRDK